MSVQKSYVYQVFNAGSYIGDIPNVTSGFGYMWDINTGGTQITVTCANSLDTSNQTPSAITAEDGTILTTEDASLTWLTTESIPPIVGFGSNLSPSVLLRNGNQVIVYEYSSYYPNGHVIFRGFIQHIEATFGGQADDDEITLVIYSDGADLANYLLTGSPFSPDQSQTSYNSTVTVYQNSPKDGEFYYIGQSFVTGSVSNIGSIDLLLGGPGDTGFANTVTLSLHTSPSESTIVASVTKNILGIGSAAVQNFAFSQPVAVSAGQNMFFSIRTNVSNSMAVGYQNTNVYANGSNYDYYYVIGYVPNSRSWHTPPNSSGMSSGDLYFVTYSSTGATTANFTSQDPTTGMLTTFMSNYVSQGGLITGSSIDATGLSLTYEFITSTVYDGIKKILELSPDGFYYYVDLGTDTLYFKQSSTTANVTLVKGKHIDNLKLVATIENTYNTLYFVGGLITTTNLYSVYTSQTSISNYGPKLATETDNRVTLQATADAYGNAFITENSSELYQTEVTVLDQTMDISTLRPGQIIGFAGFGSFVDNLLLQIVEINYTPEEATLTLGILPKRIIPDFEKLRKGLIAEQTIDNPTSPT